MENNIQEKNYPPALEVCVDSFCNAKLAEQGGADRIEFCANLVEGGVTPSHSQILHACKFLKIKTFVLIRPRGGDFVYNADEIDIMKEDVRFCGEAGCEGVVFGALNPDGSVDISACREIMEIARQYGMETTFHRAFDRTANMFEALEDLVSLGFDRVLTSGGRDSALEGAATINSLIEAGEGRISILPGAGLSPENVIELLQLTGSRELHGSLRSLKPSAMQYMTDKMAIPPEERELPVTDPEKVRKVKQEIRDFHSKSGGFKA
ncbi:MAG: copper homeostasis protein CutC [Dysgonamonadaceae bacterium]|jgi:copper homeostasis protein|nr:copper homeostasis protein CutC [Dysgonamonadaceae bacterium]